MNWRKTSMMILKITIRMVVIAAIVAVFYVVCTKTFEYGAAIFSEESMDEKGKGKDVVVTIPFNTTIEELGKILAAPENEPENALIADAGMFEIQAMLYELHVYPGTYTFNTEQNVEEIIDIINAAYWEAEEAEEATKVEKPTEKKTEASTEEATEADNE